MNEFFKYLDLKTEKNIYIRIVTYGVIVSILSLSVPIGIQILVDDFIVGMDVTKIMKVFGVVFCLTSLLTLFHFFERKELEKLHEIIFTKITNKVADCIPKLKQGVLSDESVSESLNNYTDLLTIRKNLPKMLQEFPEAVLLSLAYVIFLATYSWILFGVTLVLVTLCFVVMVNFKIESSMVESKDRFNITNWLKEMTRCNISFKMNVSSTFLEEQVDKFIEKHKNSREKLFKSLSGGSVASAVVQSFMCFVNLFVTGWLAGNGYITPGQFMATVFIIVIVSVSLDVLTNNFEACSELYASLNNIMKITKLEQDRSGGDTLLYKEYGAELSFENIFFGYNSSPKLISSLNMDIESGGRVSIVGNSGAGKTTLAYIMSGILETQSGKYLFNGIDASSLDLKELRHSIGLVSDCNEIFAGTIRENIIMDRYHLEDYDLEWALDLVELNEDLENMPKGLDTNLLSEGRNLSLGLRQKILIARSVVKEPQLLVLDEAFSGIDEKAKLRIISKIFAHENPWTVINIAHDAAVITQTDSIFVLDQGKIVESGRLSELASEPNSKFAKLFPALVNQVVTSATVYSENC